MNDLFSLFMVKVLFFFTIAAIIHELGHFSVAKFFKFKVTEFCIGTGPKLYGKRYGDTEYMLRFFIPMGGHIRLDLKNITTLTSKRIAEWTLGVWAGPAINLLTAGLTYKISPLFAFVNLFLAVTNMLPLPGHDGLLIIMGIFKCIQTKLKE
jgi:membrane-associated protease RseP (regulator of RpoE activity)